MTAAVFTGCSYTEGMGLEHTSNDKDLWVNIFHSTVLGNTQLINLGLRGSTNIEIFQQSIEAILKNNCQYLFVQWTELQRWRVNPSVELYDTDILVSSANLITRDIQVNPDITYSRKYIIDVKNRFLDLQHEHYDIVRVLGYSKIIKQLCDQFGIVPFFINGLIPVDAGYFDHIQSEGRVPSDTTKYTQQQLNMDTRDDDEYFMLYDKIHKEYDAELKFTRDYWLNLDLGYRKYFYVDRAQDDLHPGIESNLIFAQHLIKNFQERQQHGNY
jgi:hypothetical protein